MPAAGSGGSAKKKKAPAADATGASLCCAAQCAHWHECAAAPRSAFQLSGAAHAAAGDKAYAVCKDTNAVISGLRQLAAAEAPSAPPEGAPKKIPDTLRLALSDEFIGPYMRCMVTSQMLTAASLPPAAIATSTTTAC